MKLDLKKLKKIHHTDDSATFISQHGHKITVNMSKLSPEMRDTMSKLPKFEGGEAHVKGAMNPKLSESKKMPPAPVRMVDGGTVKTDTTSGSQEEHDAKLMSGEIGGPSEPNYGAATATVGAANRAGDVAPPPQPKVNIDKGASQKERTTFSNTFSKGGNVPKYADGTPDAAIPTPAPQQSPDDAQAPAAPQEQTPDSAVPEITGPPAPQSATTEQPGPPAPKAIPDPYGVNATASAFERGMNAYKAGLNDAATATGEIAIAKAAQERKAAASQQQLAADYQGNLDQLNQDHQNFQNDYAAGHIDPNHAFSTLPLGRVGSAIGLILGGIGGGGQGNAALQALQSHIDRDIDAQKAELGKKANLLDFNLKQYGNMRDAADMTRLQLGSIAGHAINAAGANAQSNLAKANANQAFGQWQTQQAPLIGQMAMRRTILSGVQRGQADPTLLMRSGIIPKEEQPEFQKQLKEFQDTSAARDNVLNTFDKLVKENTVGNRIMHAGFTPPTVSALMEPMLAQMSKGLAGRFTEADAHAIRPIMTTIFNGKGTIQDKRQQLSNLMQEKMHFPYLDNWGVPGSAPPAAAQQALPFKPRQ